MGAVIEYKPLTVGELIALLEGLGDDFVIHGLWPYATSYRGYYKHVAIDTEPVAVCWTTAGGLRAELDKKLGTTMNGWKGGEYPFTEGCYVFVAQPGRIGPFLVGFTAEGEPITVEDVYF